MKQLALLAGVAVAAFLLGLFLVSQLSRPDAPKLFLVSSSQSSPLNTNAAKLLTIAVEVDGSDRFVFTPETVRVEHLNQRLPRKVVLAGEPWTDLRTSPAAWPDWCRGLDLGRAQIVQRKARDVVALEHTASGFDLYFSDTVSGEAMYEVTIAIPVR
jgi:hypothetical protein